MCRPTKRRKDTAMSQSWQKTSMSHRKTRTDRAVMDDIERWSQDRLALWMDDTIARYRMADLTPADAYYFLLTELLRVTAVTFAVMTDVTPEEFGEQIAQLITRYRKDKDEL